MHCEEDKKPCESCSPAAAVRVLQQSWVVAPEDWQQQEEQVVVGPAPHQYQAARQAHPHLPHIAKFHLSCWKWSNLVISLRHLKKHYPMHLPPWSVNNNIPIILLPKTSRTKKMQHHNFAMYTENSAACAAFWQLRTLFVVYSTQHCRQQLNPYYCLLAKISHFNKKV